LTTWNKRTVAIVILVAIVYGLWFNVLDSAAYCNDKTKPENCVAVGEILGENNVYQFWNIIGHILPGLFLALYFKKRLEYFIAGIFVSSAVMDSPLWGVARLLHGLPLWHSEPNNPYAITYSLHEWITYYYNPIGDYQVWEDFWLFPGFPTASVIFWSILFRIILAGLLIYWQDKQEREGKEFSLKNILLRRTIN
jgi:hypothetical protein